MIFIWLELLFFVIASPFIVVCFGAAWLVSFFHLPSFAFAVWLLSLSIFLQPYSTPDDTSPFLSLVEVVAQTQVGPFSLPSLLFALALLMFTISAVLRAKIERD